MFDARGHLEELAREMDAGAVAARRVVQLARLLLSRARSAPSPNSPAGSGARAGCTDPVSASETGAKSFSVSYGIFAAEVRDDHERPGKTEQERVAVGCRGRDELGADQARGARAIVDDDLLAEHFAEALRDDARHHVDRTARGRRRDHADRPVGIIRVGAFCAADIALAAASAAAARSC